MYQYGWFSPNGENVNFGILSKLTFHSLMKEKPLGNKVNKCHECYFFSILNYEPASPLPSEGQVYEK